MKQIIALIVLLIFSMGFIYSQERTLTTTKEKLENKAAITQKDSIANKATKAVSTAKATKTVKTSKALKAPKAPKLPASAVKPVVPSQSPSKPAVAPAAQQIEPKAKLETDSTKVK